MSQIIIINCEDEFLREREAYEQAESFLADEIIKLKFPEDKERFFAFSQLREFFQTKRVFVVFDVEEIPEVPEGSFLVCVPKLKLSSPGARVINVPPLKRNDVHQFILNEGERHKIDLNDVVDALLMNNGTCLRRLVSEIEKIATMVESGTKVTVQEARQIMCSFSLIDTNLLIDFVICGKTKSLILAFDRMEDGEIAKTLSYFYNNVSRVLQLQTFKNDKILQKTAFRKTTEQLNLWTNKSLVQSVKTLAYIDERHKLGDSSVKFRLKQEMIRLSQEIKNGNVRHFN